jgi:LysR family transcriptional regulator, transcriptional activator of the cysJI operon
MTLRHFKIFKTVCEENSMTSAAKKLFMTQPSISQVVLELEQYYGVRLFNRVSKKLFITDSGLKLQNYAEKILSLVDEANLKLSNLEKGEKAILRVGATITIGETFFSNLISQFMLKNNDIEIRSVVNNLESMTAMVLSDEIDIAIIAAASIDESKLKAISFHKDKLVLTCSKSHPLFSKSIIDTDEILIHKIIVREKGSDVRDLLERQNTDLKISGVYNSYNAILKSVKNNLGVAVIPSVFIPKDDNSIHAIDIINTDFKREYFIVTKKDKDSSPYIEKFIDHCFEYKKYLDF